jgi:NAD(P)-dependent dehydrogenase (short-subunit alcohol dehydrogenase family)
VVCAARTLREGDHPLEARWANGRAIRAAGGEATPVAVNIPSRRSARSCVTARETYGPIDVLQQRRDLLLPVKDTAERVDTPAVNFHAPFILSQLVLEDMIPRRSGAIVNISSGAAIGPGRGPYPQPEMVGGTCYGAEKAALERFTQGLAQEVYHYGISVACVSPSLVVPTRTVHHRLVTASTTPGEPRVLLAKAALLLATEPLDKVTGLVTYSQLLLKEYGWLDEAKGIGVDADRPVGSGYSRM